VSAPYPRRIREAVLALGEGGAADAPEIARLHGLLGDEYAKAASRVAAGLLAKPDVIALHGQTIAHLPDEHVTLQVGDAARVAARTGIPTVADLRSADVAMGGQARRSSRSATSCSRTSRAVAVLNLGGIANLTIIRSARAETVVAFDTGPANMVMDSLSAKIGATHDIDGHGAARGNIDREALDELMRDPYFARRARRARPRAVRRGVRRAAAQSGRPARPLARDALATAAALTARSIGEALRRESASPVSRVLVVAAARATRR